MAGKRPLTQVGRMMEELGINSISANSPQAKGRVERLWKTFQDRLVSELRLAGARSIQEANQVLAWFLPEYNRKFTVPAKELAQLIVNCLLTLSRKQSFVSNMTG